MARLAFLRTPCTLHPFAGKTCARIAGIGWELWVRRVAPLFIATAKRWRQFQETLAVVGQKGLVGILMPAIHKVQAWFGRYNSRSPLREAARQTDCHLVQSPPTGEQMPWLWFKILEYVGEDWSPAIGGPMDLQRAARSMASTTPRSQKHIAIIKDGPSWTSKQDSFGHGRGYGKGRPPCNSTKECETSTKGWRFKEKPWSSSVVFSLEWW